MLQAIDVYGWLMSGDDSPACEAFDAHVLASALAMAIDATQRGVPLTASLGLGPEVLRALVADNFPHATRLVDELSRGQSVVVSPEEGMLRQLLFHRSTSGSPLESCLAAIVARRAQSPHHLWQDMGLRGRNEMSWLFERHFEPLAARNVRDMKWKKFLYRTICQDADYGLCAAPSCSECDDFDHCFGDEGGDALIAIERREPEASMRLATSDSKGEIA